MLTIILSLLQAAMPAPASSPPDVVVRGERLTGKRDRIRDLNRQIDAILPPIATDQPLARYQTPICPGVMGLTTASAQAVVDRIGVVADTLGLPVGEPGCDPNLLVVVTDDARAATRRLAARRQGAFQSQSVADMRRLQAELGGARGWTESEIRNRDGERLTTAIPGDPSSPAQGFPVLATSGAGRVVLGFRRDIVSSVIVIDAAAARGRDTGQIADYAALRGLAGARLDGPRRIRSILNAFTPDGDAAAPGELTDVDWGILRGLYVGNGNRPSGATRAEMLRVILAAPEPSPLGSDR